jgi:hypothetical protein
MGTVESALGATTGLLAVGIMSNVAAKAIKPVKFKPIRHKVLKGGKLWQRK